MAENPLDKVLRLTGRPEDFIRLTRHVRTPAGVKKYGKSVGSEISKLNNFPTGTVGVIDNSIINRPNEHYKKTSDGRWEKVHHLHGSSLGSFSSSKTVAAFSDKMKFTAPLGGVVYKDPIKVKITNATSVGSAVTASVTLARAIQDARDKGMSDEEIKAILARVSGS